MVKHIVFWNIKENALGKSKSENMLEMQKRLLDLKKHIPQIKHFEVGINSLKAASDNYDICLISHFESFADLENYQQHAEHIKIAQFIKEIRENRACIDFEY